MNTTQDTQTQTESPERDDRAEEHNERLEYEPPRIESSSVFHTVSNGPVPGYCSNYGG